MRGIVWYAIVLHLLWGAILLGGAQHTAGLSWAITVSGGNVPAGAIMIACAVLALCGIETKESIPRKFVCLAPQQFLLTWAALAAVECVLTGRYADGTPRPRMFILADQIQLIIPALLHAVAVIAVVTEGIRMPWTRQQ